MDNYDEEGALRPKGLKARKQMLYKGMRVFLTKNMDKREDFVNGMGAVVEHFDKTAQRILCLQFIFVSLILFIFLHLTSVVLVTMFYCSSSNIFG